MNTNVKVFISVIVLLIAGTAATAVMRGGGGGSVADGKYDTFATCLKDQGAVFYGAFWCSHCQAQKKMFGASQKLLPYVECSTPDAKGQTPICLEKEISGFPTWEFTNNTTLESVTAPYKCTGASDEPEACKRNAKPGRTAWIVDSMVLSVLADPTQDGTKWTFPALSRMYGEIPLESLSKVSSCELPSDEPVVPEVIEEETTNPTE